MSAIWQIYLPFFMGSGAILGLGVWAMIAAAKGADVSRFADVSTVLLVIPVIFVSLIPLVLLSGIVYGVSRLIVILPRGTRRVQEILDRIQRVVKKASDTAVMPIFRVKGVWAGLKRVWQKKSSETTE